MRTALSLRRLRDLAQVAGGDFEGIGLSPWILPVVDVTRLVEAESGGGVLEVEQARSRSQTFDDPALGPHGSTERWSYTVPDGRRAVLDRAVITIIRSAAGGAAGLLRASIMLQRLIGGTLDPARLVARAQFIDNAVGARDRDATTGKIELFSGDILTADTVDLSTTTSLARYTIDALIREFN